MFESLFGVFTLGRRGIAFKQKLCSLGQSLWLFLDFRFDLDLSLGIFDVLNLAEVWCYIRNRLVLIVNFFRYLFGFLLRVEIGSLEIFLLKRLTLLYRRFGTECHTQIAVGSLNQTWLGETRRDIDLHHTAAVYMLVGHGPHVLSSATFKTDGALAVLLGIILLVLTCDLVKSSLEAEVKLLLQTHGGLSLERMHLDLTWESYLRLLADFLSTPASLGLFVALIAQKQLAQQGATRSVVFQGCPVLDHKVAAVWNLWWWSGVDEAKAIGWYVEFFVLNDFLSILWLRFDCLEVQTLLLGCHKYSNLMNKPEWVYLQ